MPHTPSSDRATTRNPETAPPRIATWTASTRLRRAADAVRTLVLTATNMPMIPDAIEHAAPTRNANAVMSPIGRPASCPGGVGQLRHVRDRGRLDQRDDEADDHRAEDRDDPDGRVLAPDEGDGSLEDRAGHVLHRLGALVPRQHVAREVAGEQDRDDARDRDEPQERVGHQGLQCLLRGIRDAVVLVRGSSPRRGPGSPSSAAARVTREGSRRRGSERRGTRASAAESVCVGLLGGQTAPGPGPAGRVGGNPPYTPRSWTDAPALGVSSKSPRP